MKDVDEDCDEGGDVDDDGNRDVSKVDVNIVPGSMHCRLQASGCNLVKGQLCMLTISDISKITWQQNFLKISRHWTGI